MDDDIFDEIYGLHCHICTELLSTDINSKLAPAQISCGHYVCVGCFDKLKIEGFGNGKFRYVCGLCSLSFTTIGTKVAEGFVDLIERIAAQLTVTIWDLNRCEKCERKHFKEHLTCNRCDVYFSTEASGKNPPAAGFCGHFMCVPCAESIQIRGEDNRFMIRCKICNSPSYSVNGKRSTAHGFMSFVAEIEKKCIDMQAKSKCTIKCESCKSWIHIEMARVCKTCCGNDDSVSPPICPNCALEKHREVNHVLVKYIALTNVKCVKESKEKTSSIMETYKNLVQETSTFHKAEMYNITQALNGVHIRAEISKTLDECSATLDKLQKQIENFENISEVFVPAARTYSNGLKILMPAIRKSTDLDDDDVFADIYGLHCHVCTELFSTDSHSTLAPAETYCGHYVCCGCYEKLKKDIDYDYRHKEYEYKCALCCKSSYSNDDVDVADGFIELIKRIKTQLNVTFPDVDNCRNRKRKHYVMNDPHYIKGFTCNRCDVPFSTKASGSNPPCACDCGHYICVPCAVSIQIKGDDDDFDVICDICRGVSTDDREKRSIAYGFMAFVEEIEKKYLETQAKNRHEIKCESCDGWVHIDMARVCKTCCENVDMEFKPICLNCVLEKHREENHDLVKYISIKNVKDVKGSEERSTAVVCTYKRIIEETSSIHREGIDNISQAFHDVHIRAKIVGTSNECCDILDDLQKEMEDFENISEVFVPSARSYSNSLKEIAKRLNALSKRIQ